MGMPTNVRPRRQARENRINDWLSPLDAQAEMERQQGTDVGPSWSSGAKGGGALASAASTVAGGGGGGGGGASVVQASTKTNCSNGQCGTTRTTSTTKTAAPAPPTLPANPTREQRAEYADRLREYGIRYGRDYPSSANLAQREGADQRQQGDMEWTQKRQEGLDAFNKKQAEAMQGIIAGEAAASNAQKLSEAELNNETAQLTREATGKGNAAEATALLGTAVRDGMTPQDYALARERMASNTLNLPNTPKEEGGKAEPSQGPRVQSVAPPVTQEQRNVWLQQGFAAHGLNAVLASEEFFEQMTMTPKQESVDVARRLKESKKPKPAEEAVGKDPATGQPVETEKPKGPTGPEKEFLERIEKSATAIVDGLESTGLFRSQDQATIISTLDSLVGQPARKFGRERALSFRQEELDRLPPEYRESFKQAVGGRVDTFVDRFMGVVRADAMARVGKQGGAVEAPEDKTPYVPFR